MTDPKNDVVFPLSLTEIAFTLVLLLVMLLGILLLNKEQTLSETQRALESCQRQNYGGACAPDKNEKWIDPMMPCTKCISSVTDLSRDESRQVIEIGKKALEGWKAEHPEEGVESDAFLRFKQDVISGAKTLAKERDGKSAKVLDMAKELVDRWKREHPDKSLDSESFRQYRKSLLEDAKAIAQGHEVIRLEGDADKKLKELEHGLSQCQEARASDSDKLEYYKTRAGIDLPPCWVKNGRPQYTFTITLLPGQQMVLERAWPDDRQEDAMKLPGMGELIPRFGSPMPIAQFMPYEEQILKYSNTADDGKACRYYVRLGSKIPDTQSATRARHQIEHGFYKYELQ